ncbi:MAG TPA: hypothetical protein VNI52_04950 [Sphingobacteriaceae bacterium]|nr:hypothetical protein [Sphingobacteriaceae bacterium]
MESHAPTYLDSIQKIYQLNKYPIAVAGLTVFNKITLRNLFIDFKSKKAPARDIEHSFALFMDFLINERGVNEREIFLKNNSWIMGSYETGVPKLLIAAEDSISVLTQKNDMAFSHIQAYQTFSRLKNKYKLPLTMKHAAGLAEETIRQYPKEYNLETEIGGPLTIIKITPTNKVMYLKSFKPKVYNTYGHFLKSILANETKVNYIYHDSKKKLFEIIQMQLQEGF